MKTYPISGFHSYIERKLPPIFGTASSPGGPTPLEPRRKYTVLERDLSYKFNSHYHPFVPDLIQRLIEGSVDGLQGADTESAVDEENLTLTGANGSPILELLNKTFFKRGLAPSDLVEQPYPIHELEFGSSGAYAVYNWELFYHIPLTVGIHLSRNQRFEEARQWFHYLFDPTDDSDGETPERFWKVQPFRTTDVRSIQQILVNLSQTGDQKLYNETINSIGVWKDAPFRPHLVARYRPSAYMHKAVTAYLDNLIDWGDHLFRQDTGESIDEASQLYVMAANILGPRPQVFPKKGSTRPQTYASLRKDLDAFGNAMRDVEADLPFNLSPHPPKTASDSGFEAIRSLGQALYFCVPQNDKLLAYWDTVADRLFKIRNSLNIHGIFRQLPLFEPPIDPALLAKGAAAGLDISSVVNGLNQPLPLVRFQFLIQKATEICVEVKSLGGLLLSALEKADGEALALLRAKHEKVILGLTETVKYGQWQEAIKNREGVEKSISLAAQRYAYYERLLGTNESEIAIPEVEPLDTAALDKKKLKASEPEMDPRAVDVDIAEDTLGISGGKKLNTEEMTELVLLEAAGVSQMQSLPSDLMAAALGIIPTFGGHIQPLGPGVSVSAGGSNLAAIPNAMSSFLKGTSGLLSHGAGIISKIGSYSRREQEWSFQSSLAAGEITQIFKQLRAAQIREAISEHEWKNHQQSIKHAEEIEAFLQDEKKGKKTNEALYTWMKREIMGLYNQCFQFAFDVAKRAERTLQYELGDASLSYLKFDYFSGKEGLLAGEKLSLDLKKMDMAYHDLNRREAELTEHVSLLQLDPEALIRLRATGSCIFQIPEEWFDHDEKGHYFRRIKTVALTIPSVTGSYSTISCRLTLLKSSIRTRPEGRSADEYGRTGPEDDRFKDSFSSLESVVTSSARNDSGLFETNLRDERYLPFEGRGAISEWRLELPPNFRRFDYDTIADVLLHLRYTARTAGDALARYATESLKQKIEAAEAAGCVRLFSVRHEFPAAWAKFMDTTIGNAGSPTATLTLSLSKEHFPYWSHPYLKNVKNLRAVAKSPGRSRINVFQNSDATGNSAILEEDASYGDLLSGELQAALFAGGEYPAPDSELTLHLDYNRSTSSTESDLEDLFIFITWGND